jgi:predicted metal-dependent phosphoesterase TrpH
MLRTLRADLHVHTCLSPCADLEMSPKAIAEQARIKEIDILGICDHNSAENVAALVEAAEAYKISVLPGLEITSQEEVHVLALFDRLEPALELQEIIYKNLPGENDEDAFGMQVIVNAEGEVLRFSNKLLIGASTLTIEEVTEAIHSLDGLAIASHIDREGFSLIGQLGFVPEHLKLDALEISRAIKYEDALAKFSPSLPLTCSSDAHFLEDIGSAFTSFRIEGPTTQEIRKALQGQDGREVLH